MPRFRIIDGTPAPDTPAERVRQRVRKSAVKAKAHCSSCGGGEWIASRNGNVRMKLCVVCLTQGRRREMIET